jgi:hypothetical protein
MKEQQLWTMEIGLNTMNQVKLNRYFLQDMDGMESQKM